VASPRDERPAEGLRPEPSDWPKKHKVAPRENLSSIAKRYYGDERHHTLLARANGIRDADQLQIGAMLTIPQPRKP
jgi:nucleoid-associated protein YgaU